MSTLETDHGNKSLYTVLDVPQDASEPSLRVAIEAARKQANNLRRIPKRRAEAQARLAQVEEAERELLDPSARIAYDAGLAVEQNATAQPEPSQGPSADTAQKSTSEPARAPEHCRTCGAALSANANFCDDCGTSIQSAPSADPARVAEPPAQNVLAHAPPASQVRDFTLNFDSLDKHGGRGHGSLWLLALVIVVIVGASIFFYFNKMRQAPPPPVVPATQPVKSQVADLRPSQASLLNPPVLLPSPAASLNEQNIHGTITLKSDNNALSIIYPGGAEYRISQSFFNASGPASGAFNTVYGTVAITSNALAEQGGTSSTWQVQFPADQAKDINGDGFPEVVLSDFSGGAHCCTTVAVLSLRHQGAFLVFEQNLGSDGVEIRDIDGDGRREIRFTYLAEYALGSFAQGTYGVSVIYSAGGDGVYRVNTRAYPQLLAHQYQTDVDTYAKAKYDSDTGNMEEDRDLINLFFSAYLNGNRTDAYSYLARLKPLTTDASGRQDALAILENTLKSIAPEVLDEPEWGVLRSGKQASSTQPSAATDTSAPNVRTPSPASPPTGLNITPAPVQTPNPNSGTLHYAGPPIAFGQTVTFSGLPNQRLRFTFDHDAWQPFISRQEDGTQTLMLRSLRRITQNQCDVQWSVITN